MQSVQVPGDKSLTHRALVLAALASGESVIEYPLSALDTRSMAGALRRLGIRVSTLRGNTVRIRGNGLGGRGFVQPRQSLHCGNSGTAARFLLGLLAACPISARITGDASLRRRPMRRVMEPLRRMGASFQQSNHGGLPVVIRGGDLHSIDYRSEVASAQLKTAVLFAGLVSRVQVRLTEPLLSRDHTERMLRALGVPVESQGTSVVLTPVDDISPFSMSIPGDPSSAAFLIAAVLLAGHDACELPRVAVNPTRTGFLEVLRRMGAAIEVGAGSQVLGEPVAEIVVRPSRLSGTIVDVHEIPSLIDEIPILAVLASRAAGRVTFRGLSELRLKESDRLTLLARNLTSLGVRCDVLGDSLTVEGGNRPPRGLVDTGFDHRMAMAFAVMTRIPGASVRLSEDRSPRVSYPDFFQHMERVAPVG